MRWQFAAVQAHVDLQAYTGEEPFRRQVNRWLEQVRRQADPDPSLPLLVALPEDIGTPLAFVSDPLVTQTESTLRGAIETMVRRHRWGAVWRRLRYRVSWIRALFLLQADRMAQVYFSVFSQAARDYNAYVLAGSIVLPDLGPDLGSVAPASRHQGSGQTGDPASPAATESSPWGDPELDRLPSDPRAVYNVSYLFDPHGRVIGYQRKVHMVEQETASHLDITPGRLHDVRALALPGLRVGVAVCYDGFFTDVRAALRQDGATVLLQPSANPGPWTPEQQLDWLRGAWMATLPAAAAPYEVQPGCGYAVAVNPMLVGSLLDLHFEGQSSIVVAHGPEQASAPDGKLPSYQAVPGRPGFAALAQRADAEQILVTTLALPDLVDRPLPDDSGSDGPVPAQPRRDGLAPSDPPSRASGGAERRATQPASPRSRSDLS